MKTISLAAVVAIAGSAAAGPLLTESYDGTFDLTTTNWSETFDIQGFDSQGGNRILKEVYVFLGGDVQGDALAESLDNAPATIELNLQATLTLSLDATGDELAEVIPVVNTSFNADSFDGEIDFDGPSGVSFVGLSGSAMEDETYSMQSILDQFIDVGTVSLNADATGSSFGSGAGNLITQFMTEAGLEYKVEYRYNLIPAPGAAALLCLGGLVAVRRRR